MNEQKFWEIIETAWAASPELNSLRLETLVNNHPSQIEELNLALNDIITDNYCTILYTLEKEPFQKYVQILEEKLHHIDRKEIHEYTDGSDDGFLYARCFIVGMGQQYYNMVDKDPSKATMDAEAEIFGFAAYDIYEEKFEEECTRNLLHNIETGSNPNGGW
ncbi:Protein of unknown function [Filimonas lacunae]|uniref:DUF4240 domain-containing protein n=1 Tax=Filimonas lacunae TaxID=477680 RepID=A0A173MNV3_9BACT|nr:DUF4240 domain-containing protein [Filimonas lacunae]BAV09345.1 hypothetical protein FLA_5393 [Filimonas lacunae]SIS71455.1 Protein of unknown function [Filimonas lacunae]